MTDTLNIDSYWFVESHKTVPEEPLPRPIHTFTGTSVVPWRYNLNTGKFYYLLRFHNNKFLTDKKDSDIFVFFCLV